MPHLLPSSLLFSHHSPFFFPLLRTTATVSMSSFFTTVTAAVDDAKHGFSRPEMYKDSLAGTVAAYDRHVFLCYKDHLSWPPRVEASDADPLPKSIASAWKARKKDFSLKTNITVCEAREKDGFSDGDVLIFPDMIKYRGLEESNVDSFFDDVMVKNEIWGAGAGLQDQLTGSYIFVCAHGSRDVRCGVCGPALIEKLNEEIELRELKNQISVLACSHIGGHKYAGNVIIYSKGPNGNITGHWYGYVTPNDVPALLDQHIAKGEIIQKLLRGQMGKPVAADVKGSDDHKLANGDKKKKQVESNNNLSKNENMVGCCQGVDGVSCCMNVSPETNKGFEETTETDKKQGSKKTNLNWPLLEERRVLTTAGILGALAAVFMAYKFYRRSN
ncbi:hypothetical protein RIF29_18623 [Crotalaria pallida]|uniref:Altered inheritance of mitochondria protein 32 n=1 Tax=Crotalaria pallida TaxID=3830 RepID=A0AAN9EZ75_CROPI